ELLAQHLVPETLHRFEPREEAVTAQVEAISVELDRLCNATDAPVGLEHGAGPPAPREDVGRRQSRGPATDDGCADAVTAPVLRRRFRVDCAPQFIDPRMKRLVEEDRGLGAEHWNRAASLGQGS